jgi:hypothetical protein
MKPENLAEGNQLIAEFVGWRFEVLPDGFGGELLAYFNNELMWRGMGPAYLQEITSSEHGFNYHVNWNKLMPVVEKMHEYGLWNIRPQFVSFTSHQSEQKMERKFIFYTSQVDWETEDDEPVEFIFLVRHIVIQFLTWLKNNPDTQPSNPVLQVDGADADDEDDMRGFSGREDKD